VACVALRGTQDAQALKDWLAERVAACKQLADVVRRETIPQNAFGKILRQVLHALGAQRAGG
jgi:acyl-coenzyme A synthetase/AMP-(fatty) acid ligase